MVKRGVTSKTSSFFPRGIPDQLRRHLGNGLLQRRRVVVKREGSLLYTKSRRRHEKSLRFSKDVINLKKGGRCYGQGKNALRPRQDPDSPGAPLSAALGVVFWHDEAKQGLLIKGGGCGKKSRLRRLGIWY